MFAGIVTAVFVLSVPQPAAKAEAESARLVAKGEDFMVHALGGRQPAEKPGRLPFMEGKPSPSSEIILVHTSLDTGKMRVLVRSRSASWRGPPMGIDRHFYSEEGVLEFQVDKERLYVLRYSFTTDVLLRPSGPETAPGTAYALLVFHLESGREILSQQLPRPDKAKDEKPARRHSSSSTTALRSPARDSSSKVRT
jgi:hypothetical protein